MLLYFELMISFSYRIVKKRGKVAALAKLLEGIVIHIS